MFNVFFFPSTSLFRYNMIFITKMHVAHLHGYNVNENLSINKQRIFCWITSKNNKQTTTTATTTKYLCFPVFCWLLQRDCFFFSFSAYGTSCSVYHSLHDEPKLSCWSWCQSFFFVVCFNFVEFLIFLYILLDLSSLWAVFFSINFG